VLVINDDAAASIKYEDDLATDSSCFHLVVVQVMANDAGRRADVDVRVCPAFALDGPWLRRLFLHLPEYDPAIDAEPVPYAFEPEKHDVCRGK
jgi:hypothetical protein